MLLITLLQTLLDEANKIDMPFPIFLKLSSWAERDRNFERWLYQEVRNQFNISKYVTAQWLQRKSCILLLDSFDEIAEPLRYKCLQSINAFYQKHQTPIVITCRKHI
jgi:predicted NACHT family NTPase